MNHAVYLKNTTIRNFKRYIEELSTQGRFMRTESVGKAHLTTESPGRSVSFDVVQPVDSLLVRRKGAVVTLAGDRHHGELIPVFEDDSILLDTPTGVRAFKVNEIQKILLRRSAMVQALGKTAKGGLQWGIIGALAGTIVGLTSGSYSIGDEALFAGCAGATSGALFGLIDGILSAKRTREYMLNPGINAPKTLELRLLVSF